MTEAETSRWLTTDVARYLGLSTAAAVRMMLGNVGPTKTRSYRTVPLHPMVAAILVEHQAWLAARTVKLVDARMVFPSSMGTYRTAAVLVRPLARCAARAGIDKHVTAHTMRRTFNNLARLAAGDIVARAMTGHATTAMTMHYSHVSLDEKHKALDAAMGSLPVRSTAQVLGLSVGVEPNSASTPTTSSA